MNVEPGDTRGGHCNPNFMKFSTLGECKNATETMAYIKSIPSLYSRLGELQGYRQVSPLGVSLTLG